MVYFSSLPLKKKWIIIQGLATLLVSLCGSGSFASQSEKTYCALEIGEPVSLDWGRGSSPSGIEHYYRLTKIGPGNFKSELNLLFVPQEYHSDMIKKVDTCMKEANSYLKGKNGETLQLSLSEKAPQVTIRVTEDLTQNVHSHLYNTKVSCPTILHELMHLMGLTDEYESLITSNVASIKRNENVITQIVNAQGPGSRSYDCRATSPKNSLMNQQELAYLSLCDEQEATVQVCECQQKEFGLCDLTKQQAQSGSLSCPLGSVAREQRKIKLPICPNGPSFQALQESETRTLIGSSQEGFFTLVKKGKIVSAPKQSLLQPAYFRVITEPGCQKENSIYYECAKNAYQTSRDSFGAGCKPVPRICSQEMEWVK